VCVIPIDIEHVPTGPPEFRCLVHTPGCSRYFKRRVNRHLNQSRPDLRYGFE
jgi:hypothetical protein